MQATATGKRTHVRESARQRRLGIIEATLGVMRRDGLRAITHRAVAAEAAVPLAATTYYFRDLDDLLTESFLHWSATQRHIVESFHQQVLAMLEDGEPSREQVAELLADAGADYIADQVGAGRGDRVLEFAFMHEAVRLPGLREVVERQQRNYIGYLTEFHAALGSPAPAIDAQISNSLLLGLEKGALLSGAESIDRVETRAVLLRYLRAVLGPTDPTPPGGRRGNKTLSRKD